MGREPAGRSGGHRQGGAGLDRARRLSLLPADLVTPALAALGVFLAGFLKGYSGFGFALLAVGSLSLVLVPRDVVPTTLVLAIVSSFHLLPRVWKDIDWASVRLLLAGAVLTAPLGVTALTRLPAAPMRVVISLVIVAAALLLSRRTSSGRRPGRLSTVVTGLVSGLLNGSTGMGGPPVILFYVASSASLVTSRASIIAYLLAIDVASVALVAWQGTVDPETLAWSLVLLPGLLLGIALGHRGFVRLDPELSRRCVVGLLVVLALAGLARGLAEWGRG